MMKTCDLSRALFRFSILLLLTKTCDLRANFDRQFVDVWRENMISVLILDSQLRHLGRKMQYQCSFSNVNFVSSKKTGGRGKLSRALLLVEVVASPRTMSRGQKTHGIAGGRLRLDPSRRNDRRASSQRRARRCLFRRRRMGLSSHSNTHGAACSVIARR